MAYVRSRARVDFEQNVNSLIQQAKKGSQKKYKIPYDLQQCIFRNSVFQCSSALEEYVYMIFSDWIDCLNASNESIQKIPKEVISLTLLKLQKNIFHNYFLNGNEEKFIKNYLSLSHLNKYFDQSTKISDINIHKSCITEKKYPSAENLNTIFKRFGINNFFDQVNGSGSKNFKLILSSFSDIRTAISHEFPVPDYTYKDIYKSLNDIINFVCHIDRVLYKHVCRVSGVRHWKR